MSKAPHFSEANNLTESLISFLQFARQEGLPVGPQETFEVLQAAGEGGLQNSTTLKYILKSICCCSLEEIELFERIFEVYWRKGTTSVKGKTTYHNKSNIQKQGSNSLVLMGKGNSSEGNLQDGKNVSGANRMERVRKTDFSKITEIDSDYLEALALRLWRQMSLRLKRKRKAAISKGQIDLRQTIRHSISTGGDPIELKKKKRIPRKQRLVIILDVSGSMDKYSFYLLRFVWALRTHFEAVEAFIFSTRLIRITDYLDSKDLGLTLSLLSAKAHHWSSGTKIGECFQAFNDNYAKRILNRQSTVIVLSDGLDTGEPELLSNEIGKIKRRTRRLVWLNPLKGMQGYEPIARGMSAALPAIDIFQSAHNLDSLLELENYLNNV